MSNEIPPNLLIDEDRSVCVKLGVLARCAGTAAKSHDLLKQRPFLKWEKIYVNVQCTSMREIPLWMEKE